MGSVKVALRRHVAGAIAAGNHKEYLLVYSILAGVMMHVGLLGNMVIQEWNRWRIGISLGLGVIGNVEACRRIWEYVEGCRIMCRGVEM